MTEEKCTFKSDKWRLNLRGGGSHRIQDPQWFYEIRKRDRRENDC